MPNPAPSGRATILVGLLALGAVLAILLAQGGNGPRPADFRAHGRADLPGEATPTGSDGLAQIPRIPLEGPLAEQAVDLAAVAATPSDFAGKVFRCRNRAEMLPVAWRPAASSGDLAKPADTPAQYRKLLGHDAGGWARHRLPVACARDGEPAVPVQVFFDTVTAAAIPKIGAGTELVLQLLGTDPAGNLAARYLQLAGRPRQPDGHGDDWLGALLQPVRGAQLSCTCDGPAELLTGDYFSAAQRVELAATATAEGSAEQVAEIAELAGAAAGFARVQCRDRWGGPVAVVVHVPSARQTQALALGPGTVVHLRLLGEAAGTLVALHEKTVAGEWAYRGGDLRRLLLLAPPIAGQEFECASMGKADLQPASPEDGEAAAAAKEPLAPGKAWVVCQQADAPPVHALIFAGQGHAEGLRTIARGAHIKARLLMAAGDRLVGLLVGP